MGFGLLCCLLWGLGTCSSPSDCTVHLATAELKRYPHSGHAFTRLHVGDYVGIMEKIMETTIMGLGFRVLLGL